MKKTKIAWMLAFVILYSCVTVNIYFPAQEAQKKAQKIVNEIRGKTTNIKNKPTSFKINFFTAKAYASSNVLNATNAKIKAIKSSMKNRFKTMKPYYEKGYLAETLNGFLKVYKKPKSLKELMMLSKLVNAENNDRKLLYKEVAKTLHIQSTQVDKLQRIFAKQWQDTAPKGTYIQTQTGWIRK
jgi:uncharacterized protein YdbL (DUF1318 family)